MPFSVIFDMDGVIVDNGYYHQLAWEAFCKNYNISFSGDDFKTIFFGRTNEEILPMLFQKELTKDEIQCQGKEKEILYREIYKPYIAPLKGLVSLLIELRKNNHATAVATSAPRENVDFVLDELKIRQYFDVIVDDNMVAKGKPDPEIYLKAVSLLNTLPPDCIVFEDSLSGTKSAFDAGTNVVGLTTTLPKEKHINVHYVINDFSEVSVKLLDSLFNH